MNDPLGLFEEDNNSDPLGLFADEEPSFLDKAKGAGEAAIGMVAGLPSQIVGGLVGGSQALVNGIDKGMETYNKIQESNFGFGEYRPSTAKGKEYTENVSNILNKPVEWAGDAGEAVGGNAGRYVGELLVGSAMELLEPGAIYAGAKGVARRAGRAPKTSPKVDAIRTEQNNLKGIEVDVTTPDGKTSVGRAYSPNDGLDGQMNLFEPEVEGRGISPYEAVPGDWRIDENGMPIKADLSMDVQNMQNPLQRNLWGDELETPNFGRDPNAPLPMDRDLFGYEKMSEPVVARTDPEAAIPLTEAIDSMGWAQRRGALKKTKMGREMQASGELETAKMDAERLGSADRGFNARMRKQGGAIDPDVFLKDFPEFVASTIKDAGGKLKALYRGVQGDYGDVERPMLGTLGEGIYLTESKTLANNYAKNRQGETGGLVKSAYVDMRNPFEIEMGSPEHRGLLLGDRGTRKAFSDNLKAQGFDGVVVKNGNELKEVMAFSPSQVQNAFSTPASRIPKSQRGGVYFGKNEVALENSLAKSADDTFIPENPDVAKAIEKAKTEKDGKLWTYAQSGATSAAMKSGSSIIQAASRIVQNATKRADLLVRQTVFPAEKAIQRLSKQEVIDLGAILKDEMFSGKRFDGDVLVKNLSAKQLEAYVQMRDLFDKTLDAQNAARLAKGQEPITPHEAYMASRWQGDFRQPVHDADGKLVWYLAAHTKAGLDVQAKALTKANPNLVIDKSKAHTVRSQANASLQSAYTTLLDVLGRDDPAVDAIKKIIEEQTIVDGEMALAQEKHFKEKTNIRGFVGDRPGKDGAKETLAMFQQQIQYAKNGYKWSELQKAAEDIAAIVSDKDLQATQPNNVKYVREYFKNAVGMGEARVVQAMNDTLREGLGVSPQLLNNAIGNMKSFFITQKLVVSMGYMASNILQSANVLPYLTDLRVHGVKGNPLSAVSTGVLAALPMAMSHYMGSAGMKYVDSLPTQFLKDAFRYAEDNGVTARSVYDEAPVEDSFNKTKRYVINPAQKVTNFAETLVRSTAFMTFAEFLHSSGKYKTQSEIFQKAEELTNMSMVDYRETERPLAFSKAGAAGNFANTLQTFPVSFYNQYAYMLGQVKKGGIAGALPLLTMLAVHYGMAGMMGIPGFEDTEKLYKWIRDNALSDSTWNKAMKSPFFSDPKMWMVDNWGQGSVYGALSDKTGIGMTSRVAAPGGGSMIQAPGGPVLDIAGQVGAVASAVADPTNTTKLGQAAMKVAPVGLQGLLETAPFMKDITYVQRPDGSTVFMRNSDLKDRRGGYERTPEEIEVRKYGVRSQKEVLTRDIAYSTSQANQALTKKSGELIDRYYDAIRRGDTKKVKELATLYMDISGKEISSTALDNQIKEEWYSEIEKQNTKTGTPRQLLNAAKMNKLLESK